MPMFDSETCPRAALPGERQSVLSALRNPEGPEMPLLFGGAGVPAPRDGGDSPAPWAGGGQRTTATIADCGGGRCS